MKQTFEEKVRAMSAKEIIMAMVEGLRNPVVKVDMRTFGEVGNNGICYGCAATSTICKISGKIFEARNIDSRKNRSLFVNANYHFLKDFENAIDDLRMANIESYNYFARESGFATITEVKGISLSFLRNNFNESQLQSYILLANAQN